MPRTSSLASVQIDVCEEPQELFRPEPEVPFRILVAGDFSGGAKQNRRPIPIDRDNFDYVLARIAPELRLPFDNAELPVQFRKLDDFHPDRLFERLGPFQALRDLRQRLSDRSTFSAAAAELAPAADLSGAELIAQTDAAITGQMRAVLHHRDFQALEAAWRGLSFLTRRLKTGENLKLYLLDMPQAELASAAGLAELWRLAVDEAAGTPGTEPWAVMAGLYYFGPEHEAALSEIAATAGAAGAPFLAGLAPDVARLTPVFEILRRSPGARWIGLALPRFLLRLPYGGSTDATERFAFEEMPSPPEHQRYLWGHPAIACAYLLGEAFTRHGWEMRPDAVTEIGGLPAHVCQREGEPELKPCVEVLLTEEAAELLLERGFMPLLSIEGTDRVRLVRFQSIAQPAASLAGRWA